MSILNAIKNLGDIRMNNQLESFKMNRIEKLENELAETLNREMSVPPEVELKKLLKKFINGTGEFSRKEINNLPFIIYYDECTDNDVAKVLKLMNFSKERHLQNIINTYLLNYDQSNKTRFLKQFLQTLFKRMPKEQVFSSTRLNNIYQVHGILFSDDCLDNISKLYTSKLNINDVLSIIGLSDLYKNSKFIQASLKNFFINPNASIKNQIIFLDNISQELNIYDNIIPTIADVMIQRVENSSNIFEKTDAKKKCLEIFYRKLGDPRFGDKTRRWTEVSQKSKEIFLHWIVEDDLNLFFKIIEKTAVDRMWRYRKKFWQAYLPYIANTWVFLGADAQYVARQLGDKQMNHGVLSGALSDQSVLIFQIGQYIFSEWSHSGKLRVYDTKTANRFFGEDYIYRSDINSNYIDEWVHSSSSTYSWQNKVGSWIYDICGIYKSDDDWSV